MFSVKRLVILCTSLSLAASFASLGRPKQLVYGTERFVCLDENELPEMTNILEDLYTEAALTEAALASSFIEYGTFRNGASTS